MNKTLTSLLSGIFFTLSGSAGADLSTSIIVTLEQPEESSVYSGASNIRGWAVAPAGVDRAELFIDGSYRRDIPMGGGRTDVCNSPSFPETIYPDSCNSGFSTLFLYSNLTAGQHSASVVAYDLAGDHNEASANFQVTRFEDNYISNPASVDLSTATGTTILDGNSIQLTGVEVDGTPVDLTLTWRTGSQDFDIQDIFYGQQGDNVAYDFEALTTSAFLGDQDGWDDQPGQGEAWVTVDGSAANGSKVAAHIQTTAHSESAYLSRENDQNFSFPAISSSQSVLVMQFDLTGDYLARFGLGHDINSDDVLEADPLGNGSGSELGPVFGIDDRRFVVQQAGLGMASYADFGGGDAASDWFRLKLEVDFNANGGNGAGTLFYMNLSDGDTGFTAVPGLSDVNLGLTAMHPEALADEWNRMWLHLLTGGGNSPSVDNLLPNMATEN